MGVGRGLKKYPELVELYRKASDLGDTKAQIALLDFYGERGGLENNFEHAFKL